MTNNYLDVLSNLFYPQRCVGCKRRASDVLCRGCFEALPFVGQPFCGRCGAPTAFEVYGCGECSTRDFGFEDARAPLRYEGVGEELVHTLKYGGYLRIVEKVMAPLMAGVLSGYPGSNRFDAVVPVPLHRSRLAKRGFNQAELMARGIARRINAPVLDKLKVVRRTRDQVELSAGAWTHGRQDPPRRRRLHDGRHPERVCRDPKKSGRRRDPRPNPVQDMLSSCQLLVVSC
jgi:predicted amidophosphoribosyltransferase